MTSAVIRLELLPDGSNLMPRVSTNQHAKQEVEGSRNYNSSGLYWFSDVTLIAALIAIIYFCLIVPAMERSFELNQEAELLQLEQALENYRAFFGKYPPRTDPDDIQSHIREVSSSNVSIPSNLASLDEREALCFWLSGRAWKTFSTNEIYHGLFYTFDKRRIIDSDNDGWPEYVNSRGNYFILRTGKPLILDLKSNVAYPAQEFSQISTVEGE